jgi:hypothetical protein
MGGGMDEIRLINESISKLAGGPLLSVALVLAAAGTLTMAILQIIKELTPLRRWFQRNWLRRWIRERGGNETALTQLVELATGGDANAFFDLAAEQLVAQISAAGQVVLDYPEPHAELLKVLAAGAEVDAMMAVRMRSTDDTFSDADRRILIEARSRIGTRIQRNLDGLQIALSGRWRWWMQSASVVLTAILVELAIFTASDSKQLTVGAMLLALPFGLAGGYLAPVTRDLVAALQSLRK